MTDNASTRRLDRSAALYAVRRTWHGFFQHRGMDSGAALTFFAALALFPATLAIVSIVGLLDPQGDAVRVILTVIDAYVPQSTVDTTKLALEQFTRMPEPVTTLVIGLGLTIWTVGSYATAYGRTVNTIYEIAEGRRFIKLRLLMLVEAVVLIAMLSVIILIVIITPDVARTVVEAQNWPLFAIDAWSILKWPLLALLAVTTVVVLNYGTPNVKRPRIRWLSVGATFSIAAWAATTGAYSFYLETFSSADRFYGLLGGAIITLIWLYLSNLMLVIGIEVDAEFTRVRQLIAGQPSEMRLQATLRDSRRIRIIERRTERDLAEGRAICERAAELRRQQPEQRHLH